MRKTNEPIPRPSPTGWLSLASCIAIVVVACSSEPSESSESSAEASRGGNIGGSATGSAATGGSARDVGGVGGEIVGGATGEPASGRAGKPASGAAGETPSGGAAGQGGSESGGVAGAGGDAGGGGEPIAGSAGSSEAVSSFDVDVSISRGEGAEGFLGIIPWDGSCGPCLQVPTDVFCGYFTDDRPICECDPPPGSCLQSARVERDGEIIAEGEFSGEYLGLGLRVSDLFETEGNVLVLEGCGEPLTIRVDVTEVPTVSEIEVACNPTTKEAEITWVITPSADMVYVSLNNEFTGFSCNLEGSARSQVLEIEDSDSYHVWVRAYASLSSEPTPYGFLTVWALGEGRKDDPLPSECYP